ncbi:MAG: right-handed parallel beta-helix repeat-containing protein [Verrucomicrobiaceae bacterium]|nr:right-handed parallel beta-helix repeat-containing protein [Verrucomicrobiaceae bacterium]
MQGIRSLPESGGSVVLGESVFEVRQPIVIDRDGIELRGTGKETVLRLADDANCSVVILGSTTTPVPGIVKDVAVRHLTIDGNREGQVWECCGGPCDAGGQSVIRNNGITVRGAENVCIQDVVTRRARSGGVVLEKYCRRVLISGLESHDNHFDGLAAYEAEDCTFTGLHLHHNRSAALSFDWKFNRNLIEDSTLEHNGSQGVFMRDAAENKFRNLRIKHNGQQGIFIAQTESLPDTACVGNSFANLIVTGNQGHGLRINDISCTGNMVTSSRFENNSQGDISPADEDLVAVMDTTAGG